MIKLVPSFHWPYCSLQKSFWICKFSRVSDVKILTCLLEKNSSVFKSFFMTPNSRLNEFYSDGTFANFPAGRKESDPHDKYLVKFGKLGRAVRRVAACRMNACLRVSSTIHLLIFIIYTLNHHQKMCMLLQIWSGRCLVKKNNLFSVPYLWLKTTTTTQKKCIHARVKYVSQMCFWFSC